MGFLFRSPNNVAAYVEKIQASNGTARCFVAIEFFDALRPKDGDAFVAAWPTLELLLLEAEPDCPPDRKGAWAESIRIWHGHITHRQTQRGLMALRRAILNIDPSGETDL